MQYTTSLGTSGHERLNTEYVTLLWYALSSVPDERGPQGIQHSLPLLLTLSICAICCGADSYESIAQWCVEYQDDLIQDATCLAYHTPDATTFGRVFHNLNVLSFERVVGQWVMSIITLSTGDAIALDGKTTAHDTIHLVSAFAHQLKGVLFQESTDTKGKEIPTGKLVLSTIDLKNHIITADALHAQREVCAQITSAGGGYVITVKGNQASLRESISTFFTTPPWGVTPLSLTTTQKSHGRLEKRTVRMSSELNSYLRDWQGITHVFEYTRERTDRTDITTKELSVGIARLLPGYDSPSHLMAYVRGHWSIENNLHRTRDVVFKEDASAIRSKKGAQTMAILRNIVTTLFHQQQLSFCSLRRHFAAHPQQLFSLFGLHTSRLAISG